MAPTDHHHQHHHHHQSNNWLSFSLSSMEMLSNGPSEQEMFQPSSADHSQPFYTSFADNFYASAWANHKPQEAMYTSAQEQPKENMFNYMQLQPPPKLEDFFSGAGESTETQDSSLTHIYDHQNNHHHSSFLAEPPQADLKNFTGFQAFSANSGSEVEDSAFVCQTQSPVESNNGELVAYSHHQCPVNVGAAVNTDALSLGYNTNVLCSENNIINGNNSGKNSVDHVSAVVTVEPESCKKVADTFGQRTSIYRGVTRHRWTGRYEAHLWDNSCRREGQARKGRQVYLGGYDKEEKAARAYDLAALKYWGPTATTNFPIPNYTKEMEEMKNVTKQEFIASLRRKSSGFSRGASIYRGVTRHHQQGRWQARIGRVAGNKDLYLGTFATEEEAAEAYDIAAIKFRGVNAVTNFEMSRYDVEAIAKSPLPVGGTAKRLKLNLDSSPSEAEKQLNLGGGTTFQAQCTASGSSISFGSSHQQQHHSGVPSFVDPYHHNFFQQVNSVVVGGGSSDMSMGHAMANAGQPEFFIWPTHHHPHHHQQSFN